MRWYAGAVRRSALAGWTAAALLAGASIASADLVPDAHGPEPSGCHRGAPVPLCRAVRDLFARPTVEALTSRVGPAGVEIAGRRYRSAAELRAVLQRRGARGAREGGVVLALLEVPRACRLLPPDPELGACTGCSEGAIELTWRLPCEPSGSLEMHAVFAGTRAGAALLRWWTAPRA